MNTGQFDQGKMMFHARVTETFPVGYSIETMIDGKVLRGVLFSTKQSSVLPTDQSFSRRVLILVSYFWGFICWLYCFVNNSLIFCCCTERGQLCRMVIRLTHQRFQEL